MGSNYSYYLYSSGKHYGSSPRFISGDQLPASGFASLYAVTDSTAQAIVEEGTAAGFKGCVWSERLWMDFDSYAAAERAESKLKGMGYGYIAYDTGGRGAHFGILRNHAPSHLLPTKDKKWVTEHFPEADRGIYTHLHPFRLAGTPHEKTGDTKRVVSESKGSTLILPRIEKEELPAGTPSFQKGRNQSIFSCFRVMREVAGAPFLEAGKRHYALVRLAYALRDDAGADQITATYWALEWNRLLKEPKHEEEIAKTVQSVYRG